jgi:antitoxin MazE
LYILPFYWSGEMQTVVRKWGNSLAVRLPQHVVESLSVSEGSALNVKVEAGELVMRPTRPKYRLEDLLKHHKPEHNHTGDEVWGKPVGNETW